MARKRKGRPVSGVLLLHKPAGVSSNFILQRVRWLYQAEKAGHGGTLDPFAEGLLPILFGEAAKFGQYILGADKRYTVSVRFGFETATDDSEGLPTAVRAAPDVRQLDWEAAIAHFSGRQMQVPPIYSALKIDGRRAYELARRGEEPVMEARPVVLHALRLLEAAGDTAVLDVSCSKGTYIRALARDIGRFFGSAAHAAALCRTAVGQYAGSGCRFEELEKLQEEGGIEALDAQLLPLESCVQGWPRCDVPEEKIRFIRNGNEVACAVPDGQYALYDSGVFFGIGTAAAGRLQPQRLCAR